MRISYNIIKFYIIFIIIICLFTIERMENMKKIISSLLTIVFIIAFLAIPASADLKQVYEAPEGTPTIDGEMETLWDNAAWTNIGIIYDGAENTFGCAARAKIMWDKENIVYFYVEVTNAGEPQEADAVEFYLDENMDRAVGYGSDDRQTVIKFPGLVTTNNAVTDSEGVDIGRPELGKAASKRTDVGFNVEVALTLSKQKAEIGKQIGLEFMYNDVDDAGTFLTALRWNVDTPNGDAAPWQSTEFFGTLKLVAGPEPVVVEEITVVADENPPTSDTYSLLFAFAALLSVTSILLLKRKLAK